MARFNSVLKRYKFVIEGSFSLLVLRCKKSKFRGHISVLRKVWFHS